MKQVRNRRSGLPKTCIFGMALLASIFSAAQDTGAKNRCASPEAILQRYIEALGGESAIASVVARTSEADEDEPASFKRGTTEHYKYKFEWKAPDKAVVRTRRRTPLSLGISFEVAHFIFNGKEWSDSRGRRLPPQRNQQSWRQAQTFDYPHTAMWRIGADPIMVARPNDLYDSFSLASDLGVTPGTCTIRARGKDRRNDILIFDSQTGLLKTWALEMGQPRHTLSFRIDFDDYRQAGAVRFPFRAYFDFYRATFLYTKVEHNPSLQDSDFEPR